MAASPEQSEGTGSVQLRIENQRNPVADEVSALAAVTRPILIGLLYALHQQRAERLHGRHAITLWDLAREYRASDGDCGVCFEYAVHDAVRRSEPMVVERIEEVMSEYCRIDGARVDSILFGAEKQGSQRLIEIAKSY